MLEDLQQESCVICERGAGRGAPNVLPDVRGPVSPAMEPGQRYSPVWPHFGSHEEALAIVLPVRRLLLWPEALDFPAFRPGWGRKSGKARHEVRETKVRKNTGAAHSPKPGKADTMQAVYIEAHGGPEGIDLTASVPSPELGSGPGQGQGAGGGVEPPGPLHQGGWPRPSPGVSAPIDPGRRLRR